jgi:hypothetical protein
MGHKDSQSAIWIGFVIAYFGMMGGLFSVAMDATNSVSSAIFGAVSVIGLSVIMIGKLAARGHPRP